MLSPRPATGRRFAVVLLATLAGAGCAPATRPPGPPPPPLGFDSAAAAARVRDEIHFAWTGYARYAWGHDELDPVSRGPHDWYGPSLLMTPVDALDTLLVAGLDGDAARARALIDAQLDFDRDLEVQVFEVTIRLLGGLLSSYQMTGDPRLLELATDLGNRLLPAFDSPTGMPYRFVNLRTGAVRDANSNPAEIGSLILEFGTLARLAGRPELYDKPKRALVALYSRRSPIGLVGEGIDVETGEWTSPTSHVGGGIDSYYEYLLKCEELFGDRECGAMFRTSLTAVDRYLAEEVGGSLWYGAADMRTGRRTATNWSALQAFLPGVLALGGELDRARRFAASSFAVWERTSIEPELYDYRTRRVVEPAYPLRPEIVESAYVLHEMTGDPRYLAMGRVFLRDLRTFCRVDAGYTTLTSVVTHRRGDRMPSYFLAETLKYLYLLFEPSPVDFRHVVFNTEAHPLRPEPPLRRASRATPTGS